MRTVVTLCLLLLSKTTLKLSVDLSCIVLWYMCASYEENVCKQLFRNINQAIYAGTVLRRMEGKSTSLEIPYLMHVKYLPRLPAILCCFFESICSLRLFGAVRHHCQH